jgi:hypothetical protein
MHEGRRYKRGEEVRLKAERSLGTKVRPVLDTGEPKTCRHGKMDGLQKFSWAS